MRRSAASRPGERVRPGHLAANSRAHADDGTSQPGSMTTDAPPRRTCARLRPSVILPSPSASGIARRLSSSEIGNFGAHRSVPSETTVTVASPILRDATNSDMSAPLIPATVTPIAGATGSSVDRSDRTPRAPGHTQGAARTGSKWHGHVLVPHRRTVVTPNPCAQAAQISVNFVNLGAWKIFILGIVQGITELLPISSTAHMRIVPALLGWPDPGSAFSAAMQMAALAAVISYFWGDVVRLAGQSTGAVLRRDFGDASLRLVIWIIL